jgi:hypothetical protein
MMEFRRIDLSHVHALYQRMAGASSGADLADPPGADDSDVDLPARHYLSLEAM